MTARRRQLWRTSALMAVTMAAAAAAFAFGVGRDGAGHRVHFEMTEAASILKGQHVRAAGVVVGHVSAVEPVAGGAAARVDLYLDDRVWPLPSDSRIAVRWGGTISYGGRYVELLRGRASRTVPEGGALATRAVTRPVEFGEVLNTFTPELRGDLRAFLNHAGGSLLAAKPALRRALEDAPAATAQARDITEDLASTDGELATLAHSLGRVSEAADRADPGLGELLTNAALTMRAVASESDALSAGLSGAPAALRTTQRTLRRARSTLASLGRTTTALAPGIAELRRTSPVLVAALRILDDVSPVLRRTLATARRASTDLTRLLQTARALLPTVESAGRQAGTQLNCVRPYAPDIAGFASTWADFAAATDGKDRYGTIANQRFPFTNAMPLTSKQIMALFPGLTYAFPQPPGFNAGQPWFIPQCGVGPDALDPAKDPESGYRGPRAAYLKGTRP